MLTRKGRKGQRRIERIEKEAKAWASAFEALIVAERAAILSGFDTDFILTLTLAYTGMRWGEALGLRPEYVRSDAIDVHWKLYELNGRFTGVAPKTALCVPSTYRHSSATCWRFS